MGQPPHKAAGLWTPILDAIKLRQGWHGVVNGQENKRRTGPLSLAGRVYHIPGLRIETWGTPTLDGGMRCGTRQVGPFLV